MLWLEALEDCLQRGEACVLVTISVVRGHAPRAAGAKMLIAKEKSVGSVGGGNLEAAVVQKAMLILEQALTEPISMVVNLGQQAGEFGMQCCGGEVTILLEPFVKPRPQVAIFGVGHVGFALAKILSNLEIELLLYDTRAEMLTSTRFKDCSSQAIRRVFHYQNPSPEFVFLELRPEATVLIMTHDHSQDISILEVALNRSDTSFIGLIGSSIKWQNFQQALEKRGFNSTDFARVTTPIGVAGIQGKAPEIIAISVAAQLLQVLKF